ncbi:MAG TPA: DUF4321 domain-containing protein [Candidatus Marinimicrobia bacterium]|nr:DUF4321 domain-containing protein [Candidatus Neomarinimicrobiota bacterium]
MNKRTVSLIVLGVFVGAVIGGVLGELFGWMLPESVVKEFFLTPLSFDLEGLVGNETGVIILDLKIITLKFGLAMKFNFTSVIGIAAAYYILRYFR